MTGGAEILANILHQPSAWSKLADEWPRHADLLDRTRPMGIGVNRLVYVGCGSALFVAQTLAATASDLLGLPAVAVAASDAVLFPAAVYAGRDRTALVALSRSGQTSETLEAMRVFRQWSAGPVWAITASPRSDLALAADEVLDASAGEEAGIVQTSAVTTMLLLGLAAIAYRAALPVAGALARLPEAASALIEASRALAELWGDHPAVDRFFFLGSGPWRGIASEAMLKVKEMSRAQSESFHTLEFRHGLGANANENALVVGYLSERAAAAEQAVLDEFRTRQGVTTLAIGANARVQGHPREFALPLPADLPKWARLPLGLPFAQLLGLQRALYLGHDPDEPTNLQPFVALNGPLA